MYRNDNLYVTTFLFNLCFLWTVKLGENYISSNNFKAAECIITNVSFGFIVDLIYDSVLLTKPSICLQALNTTFEMFARGNVFTLFLFEFSNLYLLEKQIKIILCQYLIKFNWT